MIPYEFDAERFSRWMSYVLRHNPARYGLQPDRHGYVDLDAFFLIAKRRYPSVNEEHLHSLVETGGSGRFEIAGNRLRARYGHSIPVEPTGPPVEPPQRLYHGAEAADTEAMLSKGLSPMERRMIHLSETIEDALAVARRKTGRPCSGSWPRRPTQRASRSTVKVACTSPHRFRPSSSASSRCPPPPPHRRNCSKPQFTPQKHRGDTETQRASNDTFLCASVEFCVSVVSCTS